jgi:hypothetical protein
MKNPIFAFFFWTLLGNFLPSAEIKHRFLALDESRFQILYVDPSDPSKNWTIKVPGSRDMQLVDGKIVIGLFDG